jgi:hypothetical protein
VPISVLLAHTPGATNPIITQATVASTICKPAYVNKIKSQISKKTSTEVFAEYAIAKKMRSHYAIDHLVPSNLGGTNALTNLWPIPLKGTATPQRKAAVDAAVHKSMCAGFISLATAQGLFNASWHSVDTNLVTPAPAVSQPLWFFSDTGEIAPFFRVAVTVSNPGLEPINGVKMSWNALDASGALVGSYSRYIPTINALSSWTYVGGAGSTLLTGTPASAMVVVAEKGSYVKQAATPYAADSVQFAVNPYGIYTGATDYSVTGDITIGTNQIPSSSLDAVILLTNAAGQVVGADVDQDDNLPAVLTPGLRIAIQDDVPGDQHADCRHYLRRPRRLVPEAVSSLLLPRVIGERRASELILTA